MKLSRIVWISKCIGIYASWISNTVRDIPVLPKYEETRRTPDRNKTSNKGERVRVL